jgi:hypothetical protein
MRVREVTVVLGRSPDAFSAEQLRQTLAERGIAVAQADVERELQALADDGAIERDGETFAYAVSADELHERMYAQLAEGLGIETGDVNVERPSPGFESEEERLLYAELSASLGIEQAGESSTSSEGVRGDDHTAGTRPGALPDLADDPDVYGLFAAELGVER